MEERVTVEQAARELGMSTQGLREYMKRGLIDVGIVLPSAQGKRKYYMVFRAKLERLKGNLAATGEKLEGQKGGNK